MGDDIGQDPTPSHSNAFGAAEDADATRQAQHTISNDAVTDVNMNALLTRQQGATMVLLGANFEAGASRRNGLFDHFAALLAKA